MFLHDPRNTSLFTTEMSFPVRIASWDLRPEGEGVVMTWSPVGWDGTGRWAVLRSGGEASAGAPSEGGGSGGSGVTGEGAVGGSVASGLDAQASGPTDNLRAGEPAFLAGYSEVTHLGILSVDGTSQLTFRDPAPGSGRVSYVIELLKEDGSRRLFGPRSVQSEGGASSLVPRLLSFGPNPFRSLAEFTLFLPDGARATAGHVTLRVFDAAGRTVSTESWMNLGPGVHTLEWDGTGVSGSRLTTGVYFFSLEAGGIKSVGKLVLVR